VISSSEPRRAKRWSHICRGYTCSIIYYWNWGAGGEAKAVAARGILASALLAPTAPRSGCDCLLAIGARYFDRRRPSHCILTRLHLHKSRRLRFLSAVFSLIYSPAQPAVCVVKFWGVAAAARSRKAINVCVCIIYSGQIKLSQGRSRELDSICESGVRVFCAQCFCLSHPGAVTHY
jgi:hypothetical protein